jgi:drug/metabolite transporter (DMT)-like permease
VGLANTALMITVLLWGSMLPVLDVLLRHYDPLTLNAVRYVLAIPLSLTMLRLAEAGPLLPRGVPVLRILWLGGGIAGFVTLFNFGIIYSDTVTAIAIMSAGPVVANLVARFGFGEPPAPGIAPALAASFAGGMLAMLDLSEGGFDIGFKGGEPLLVAATGCWAWYSLAAQRWMRGMSQLRITGLTVPAAGIWVFTAYLGLLSAGYVQLPPPMPGVREVGLVVWSALGGASIAVFLWNYGVRHIGLQVSAMFMNLTPIVGVLVAIWFGASPRIEQLLGGALIVGAVIWVQTRRKVEAPSLS